MAHPARRKVAYTARLFASALFTVFSIFNFMVMRRAFFCDHTVDTLACCLKPKSPMINSTYIKRGGADDRSASGTPRVAQRHSKPLRDVNTSRDAPSNASSFCAPRRAPARRVTVTPTALPLTPHTLPFLHCSPATTRRCHATKARRRGRQEGDGKGRDGVLWRRQKGGGGDGLGGVWRQR